MEDSLGTHSSAISRLENGVTKRLFYGKWGDGPACLFIFEIRSKNIAFAPQWKKWPHRLFQEPS